MNDKKAKTIRRAAGVVAQANKLQDLAYVGTHYATRTIHPASKRGVIKQMKKTEGKR